MRNLLDPAILFFVFGMLAGALKSNLEIPQPISRFLSLYLLMALGLKGGFALAHSGLTTQVGAELGAAVLLAVLVPLLGYRVLVKLLPAFDAAAIAATYGSVSAVTFVTTTQYLDGHQIAYGGHMTAAMALMESPAIIIAVVIANSLRARAVAVPALPLPDRTGVAVVATGGATHSRGVSIPKILHESFTDGAQLLLLGAMAVGLLTGETGKAAMQPFSGDLFKGMLAFFLLDMGLATARSLAELRGTSPWLIAYAAIGPLVHASIALAIAALVGAHTGEATLLMVLAASASYIAVPAVLRYAVPEAKPARYFGLSLGVTFPLNILFGIPLYASIARVAFG
jgi:hypothetical protein